MPHTFAKVEQLANSFAITGKKTLQVGVIGLYAGLVWGFLKQLFGTSAVKVDPFVGPTTAGPRVPPPLQSVSAFRENVPVPPSAATVAMPPAQQIPIAPPQPVEPVAMVAQADDFAWQALARRSEKILAIKAYRERYGSDLSTAKRVVDAYLGGEPFDAASANPTKEAGRAAPAGDLSWQAFARRGERLMAVRVYREQYGVGLSDALKAVDAFLSDGLAVRVPPRDSGSISMAGIDEAIRRGALIEAIKLYRQQSSASLADAKAWVEQRARGQR